MGKRLLILCILALAIFFRLSNLKWDDNFHLHPDERFLTMVGNAMKVPTNLFDYFDPHVSSFNPARVGFPFFVYGMFPLTFNKIGAVIFSNDTYNDFTLQGRFVSAMMDLLVIVLIFKTALLFENKYRLSGSLKYWASFFYAIAVLPIQLSHYFAVDTFLNFFMFASFYFALKYSFGKNAGNIIVSALFLGLAAASKVTAVTILPLNCAFIFLAKGKKGIRHTFIRFLIYFVFLYSIVRIADPYFFQNRNFFDPRLNPVFVNDLKTLKSFEGADIWYPPAVQWINKAPILFSLTNLAIFGVGLPYFIFLSIGIYIILREIQKKEILLTLFWVGGFFLYQSTQFVKAMRYFIFLYPFFAIFAAFGIVWIIDDSKSQKNFVSPSLNILRFTFYILLIFCLLIWPVMFSSIYLSKNSRVVASEWIYQNIPDGSVILGESWDDPLPLPMPSTNRYVINQLPVFDPDTDEKWRTMNDLLQRADYYILSSNRGWGSIPTVPQKYPRMSAFYRDLFAEKLGFIKIKEFTSYPQLKISNFKFQMNDDWSDESFTVYDHPKVLIFEKNKGQ